jgi:HPt (histidine-containing phosphotransfer) domain-containing protein
MKDEEALIDAYFDGDRALYEEYKALCRDQFKLDVAQGDQACASGDATSLRHLAHSLKTVLRSLGQTDLSDLAFAIEEGSPSDMAAACAHWALLRKGLLHSTQG